ncbi:hypothetical protein MUN84_18935 [Hymenobacter sp. 5516J-16]|uniref:hypothetical protein n=1 Tax=Hymenobacter sp. 5516J-16 TaxID=2932253 RepID=UPI001FD15F8C|nr:hypothetical protein [Hymenobacter sp. 5516J-16]UOQ76584.1 hypothetical protein MUN84_18935 [Hymenobacter sp. 5516J-16]
MVAFYANVHWAVPRLLYRRQVLAYLGVGAAVAGAVLWAHWRLDAELEVPRRLSEARHAAFSARDWPAPGPPGPPRPLIRFGQAGPTGRVRPVARLARTVRKAKPGFSTSGFCSLPCLCWG